MTLDSDATARSAGGRLGEAVSRVDGRSKVTGTAQFAADVSMDDLTYAALVYSTITTGRVVAVDVAQAEAAPGIVLVMTHHNAPRLNIPTELGTVRKAAASDSLPIMQSDQIYWNGQPVAVVLGESQEHADYAASVINVQYEATPAATHFREAKPTAQVATSDGALLRHHRGDAESALRAALFSVDATYSTPRQNHNALELHAVTLRWEGEDLIVHDGVQAVAHVAWSLAEIFGLDESQVRVSAPFVGGAFGGKMLWQHQVLAAAAARLSGRAVRMVLGREGVYRIVGGRAQTEQRVAIGADAQGHFVSLIHTGTAAKARHNNLAEPFIIPAKVLYDSDNVDLEVRAANMDMVSNAFMRAPGEAVGSFALESAIDELATTMGVDPIALRLANEPVRDPTTRREFSSRHLVETFQIGAARVGWHRRNPIPAAVRDGEWLIGMGCAAAVYPYKRFPGSMCRVILHQDGALTVETAAHEMGMGTATVQTQLAAELFSVPISKVTFVYGASWLPGVAPAIGSQQTVALASALVSAQTQMIDALVGLVGSGSPVAGLSVDEVETAEGGLRAVADHARYVSYRSILGSAGRSDLVTVGTSTTADEWTSHYSMFSYGAQFCEVRVSAVTGETRVTQFVGAFDCGRILNAKTASSQLRGGIIMGLGLALMEATHCDERTGRITNPSLSEYHIPVHLDIPEIDVLWTAHPDPRSPMGIRGVGEIGITGVAAAVANAVYNATGVRIRQLPLTLDKVLSAGPGV